MDRLIGTHWFFRSAVAIACGLLLGGDAHAGWPDHPGTLRIENVTVVPRDAKTATVQFDISWENSWRHEANHDAAWVFFKVRAEGAAEWQHVRLAADKVLNPTGYGQEKGGTPLDFIVPDGKDGFTGMFVRRAEYGIGKVAATKVTAVWDLAANKGIKLGGSPDPPKDDRRSPEFWETFGRQRGSVGDRPRRSQRRRSGSKWCSCPRGRSIWAAGPSLTTSISTRTARSTPWPTGSTGAGAIPTGQQAGKLWARRGASRRTAAKSRPPSPTAMRPSTA